MPGYNFTGLIVDSNHFPSINRNGVLGFWGNATNPATGDSPFVAWVGPRSNPQPILRSGDTTADMPAGFEFDFVSLYSINNAGDAAGRGTITPTLGFAKQVVWRSIGGAVELVVIEGEQVPGLPAGVVWGPDGNDYEPAINANGTIVFSARLAGAGVTMSNDDAIFIGEPGSLTMVAREGDPAPGLGAGVTFGRVSRRDYRTQLDGPGGVSRPPDRNRCNWGE